MKEDPKELLRLALSYVEDRYYEDEGPPFGGTGTKELRTRIEKYLGTYIAPEVLPTTMPFGKYKGKPISTLTYQYCKTLLSHQEATLDKLLVKSLRKRMSDNIPVISGNTYDNPWNDDNFQYYTGWDDIPF